ncbi:PH domain-containing protein [Flavobacterium oreochromis]|uniref:PH domain-containing protein n=1 Tax=Flavobacterium oreochromis TaxID=2906078 RepID=UPI00385F31F2
MINDFKKFLNEEQDPKSVEKILDKVTGLLTSGEEVQYVAVQKKAINFFPDCVAVTNKRVIFCRPKNFGLSMDFQDYLWKDIVDCHIKENILGSDFKIKTTKGQINTMDYLPKAQARKLYQFGQNKEEEMQGYRRQMDLENKRASAGGGITVNTNIPTSNQNENTEDQIEKLQKLKKLLESEIISQQEFDNKKLEILSKL